MRPKAKTEVDFTVLLTWFRHLPREPVGPVNDCLTIDHRSLCFRRTPKKKTIGSLENNVKPLGIRAYSFWCTINSRSVRFSQAGRCWPGPIGFVLLRISARELIGFESNTNNINNIRADPTALLSKNYRKNNAKLLVQLRLVSETDFLIHQRINGRILRLYRRRTFRRFTRVRSIVKFVNRIWW